MPSLSDIKKSFESDFAKTSDQKDIEKLRVKYLGRKGVLTNSLKSLKNLKIEERRKFGPEVQSLKREIEKILKNKTTKVGNKESRIDLTAPGRKVERGHLHPLTLVERDIRKIFSAMNFSVIEGPEVETEYYNFDALDIPPSHPARDMWDTFWIKKSNNKKESTSKSYKSSVMNRSLLRTHTSPVQVRYMEKNNPPFQIISPGRVFRYEATDSSHEINFYHLEGLVVGKNITLANFKFVIEEFLKKFFKGRKIEFRYRPSYFPFVEPGLEVDIKLAGKNSKSAPKWLEVMGAGMVHPHVFEYARYNPREWRGFAFGIGIDRLAMIKYNVPDIRLLYSGDLRLIKQF